MGSTSSVSRRSVLKKGADDQRARQRQHDAARARSRRHRHRRRGRIAGETVPGWRRAIVAVNPNCGECFQCLRGRGDRCQFLVGGVNNPPFATMTDGTEVIGGRGGFSEVMVAYEEWCVPIFSTVSSLELSLFGCVGSTGLGPPTTFVPVEPGSNVVVFGAGPIGLSMIQGARIMGAAEIISVEPIRYRREIALKVGATLALDPNVERDNLVEKIRDLCKGPTDRKFSGGRDWTPPTTPNYEGSFAAGARGPDFVFEASTAARISSATCPATFG